jgi:hypothetical protein
VIAVLDLLFACAFSTVALAIFSIGVRIMLVSNDQRLVVLATFFAIAGTVSVGGVSVWAFAHVSKTPKSRPSRSDWREIIRRYPVLLGPSAYYLGEFRPTRLRHATWFSRLMQSRRALDGISFVAWHGTLATYYLVIGAFVSAVLQSSPLFTLVVAVFVLLIVVAGAAFCLLSLVVLVHAAVAEPNDSRMRELKAVPRIGPLWVRGFRRYYERVIRPALIASEGHAP